MCKAEGSHRDKTVRNARDTLIAESVCPGLLLPCHIAIATRRPRRISLEFCTMDVVMLWMCVEG